MNWADAAPQFTSNGPLNQKLLFLKRHWPEPAPTTLVVGASMAINNFDSDLLQASQGAAVINTGANGLTLSEVDHLFGEVDKIFAVKGVILVSQFNELRDVDRKAFMVPQDTFARYVTGRMNWVEEFSFRDLASSLDMIHHRRQLLDGRSAYTSSDFTQTGSVPLEIHGPQIDQDRWNGIGLLDNSGCQHCGDVLQHICSEVRGSGRPFTLVEPTLSPYILSHRPDIARRYAEGRVRIRDVMAKCDGKLFDLSQFASFSDDCFVDFMHLNAQGARALTNIFIDWQRGKAVQGQAAVSCAGPARAALGSVREPAASTSARVRL